MRPRWRDILRKRLLYLIEAGEHRFDRMKLYLKVRHGRLGPVYILPYLGHGTARAVHITGRVMEEKKVYLPAVDDSAWRNLRAMIRRFLSAEVPGARVRVRFAGRDRLVVADDEGFFQARMEPPEPLPEDNAWREIGLELMWPLAKGQREVRAVGEVMVPPEDVEFGVISDIDDTVVLTGATSAFRTLRLLLFSNAHTRLPLEGVAPFYRALRAGPDGGAGENPIFYVSTSPWNLYDLISDFLDLRNIPAGPIFLKDWGGVKDALRGMDHRAHKLLVIRELLDTYPGLPFVLVGDSGQQDAETYAQVARENPGRIRAIYIRDIERPITGRDLAVREISAEVEAIGVPMLLVEDTVTAANHAADHGLIDPASLPEIRAAEK